MSTQPIYKKWWFSYAMAAVLSVVGYIAQQKITAYNNEQARIEALEKQALNFVTKNQHDNSCAVIFGQINNKVGNEQFEKLMDRFDKNERIQMQILGKLNYKPVVIIRESLPEIKPIEIKQLETKTIEGKPQLYTMR